MVTYRLFIKITSLILAITLAACGSASSTGPTSTPIIASGSNPTLPATPSAAQTQAGGVTSNGGCTNPYFPVSSGATWAYTSTGSIVGDYSYTRTLSGVSDKGFITNDVVGGVTRTTQWSCDNGNLTSLAAGSTGTLVSGSSMTMTVDSVSSTGYIIPAAFTDGNTWSESLSVNGTNVKGTEVTGTVVSDVTTNCTAIGTESVKVPAGTFDAVKITCHSNQVATVTLTVGGSTGPITIIQDSIQWYAQGIGLVQTVNSGDAGNETIQLISYSIP